MRKTTKKVVSRKVAKKSHNSYLVLIVIIAAVIVSLGFYGYKRSSVKNAINEVVFSQNQALPVSFEITPELITANSGDTFTVDLSIDPNNLPVTATFISLNFNSQILQYVKTDLSGSLDQVLKDPIIANEAVMFALGSKTKEGLKQSSKLATVTFKKIQNQPTSLTFGNSSKVAVVGSATNVLGTTNKALVKNVPAPSEPVDNSLNVSVKKISGGAGIKVTWNNLGNDPEFSNYTFVVLDPSGKRLVRTIPTTNNVDFDFPNDGVSGEYQVRVWANFNGTEPSKVEIKKISLTDGKVSL